MSLPNFSYFTPRTVESLCALLARHGEKARVIAGGTDVLVRMKTRAISPSFLVDVKGIRGLDAISYEPKKGLRIGALATLREVEGAHAVREHYPVLCCAAHLVGSVQIRNRATVAGNLCNAAPGADMAPSLIALGATVTAVGTGKERSIDLNDFFLGPYRTVLGSDEVVSEIRVPAIPKATGVVYHKHSVRKAMDLALVGVAVKVRVDPGKGTCTDVRIVLGAVAPTPLRARRAEELLLGQKVSEQVLSRAAEEAAAECQPRSSNRGSAEYKREMVRVFTRRVLEQAVKIAGSRGPSASGD